MSGVTNTLVEIAEQLRRGDSRTRLSQRIESLEQKYRSEVIFDLLPDAVIRKEALDFFDACNEVLIRKATEAFSDQTSKRRSWPRVSWYQPAFSNFTWIFIEVPSELLPALGFYANRPERGTRGRSHSTGALRKMLRGKSGNRTCITQGYICRNPME